MSSAVPKKPKAAQGKVALEEEPTRNLLTYYFCCFCILPKRTRKLKRRAEKASQELEESVETYEDEDEDEDSDDEREERVAAAVRIQSLVRGFQTRGLMSEYWKEALEEANAHWLKIVRARELAWLIEERKLVARKQVCTATQFYSYC